MNIFVVDQCPKKSAEQLPDKHIVKMPLETCQMVSVIYSDWYYNWGTINKVDGNPYSTKRGAFRNHPCTKWASESYGNLAWLLSHGLFLCLEYTERYNKRHSCQNTIEQAIDIFNSKSDRLFSNYQDVIEFTRAMPDELKNNTSISTMEAYQKYVASKPWVKDNYLRKPERLPEWIFNYA
jgi:hypothetical protein